jgi:hypothetical protein
MLVPRLYTPLTSQRMDGDRGPINTDDLARTIAAGALMVLSAMGMMTPKAVHNICWTIITAVVDRAVCVFM